MAHRGRLNVLAHNLGRAYDTIFAEFEGASTLEAVTTIPQGGTGDVKYHHGTQGSYELPDGETIRVNLESNPSHLEYVSPVVEGATRAAQTTRQGPHAHQDTDAAVPIVIHGDASFPAQGVVAETLNLQALDGYKVGGTLHLITNNQIGFTTDPDDARSTRWASDLAKGFDVPIIHVNADDVPACMSAVRLAFAFRKEFGHDVLIDLIGYRRFGHNESDEPAYTQPEMYAKIKTKKRVAELWAERLVAEGVVSQEDVERQAQEVWDNLTLLHQRLKAKIAAAAEHEHEEHSTGEYQLDRSPSPEVDTAVPAARLRQLGEELLRAPEGFTVHPKLVKQLERRREALAEENPPVADRLGARRGARVRVAADRGHAHPPDRTGHRARHLQPAPHGPARRQDRADGLPDPEPARRAGSARAAQQPAVGARLHGLRVRLQPGGARDARAVGGAVRRLRQLRPGDRRPVHRLGPRQVGPDLAPDAAVAARLRGLGPGALLRAPRALPALAAEGNIRVASPTTPAQYFHLLRRQALIAKQRPLVIMTPKSLLRLPQATSSIADLAENTRFQPVLAEPGRRRRAGHASGAVHRQDLLRPRRPPRPQGRTPASRWRASSCCTRSRKARCCELIQRYPNLREVVWVQEEPRNMGARAHMFPRLMQIMPEDIHFGYIGRPERASPGEGYPAAHIDEQNRIVTTAIDLASRSRSTRARRPASADARAVETLPADHAAQRRRKRRAAAARP